MQRRDGEHSAVAQILQKPKTKSEVAEKKLARQVCRNKHRKRAKRKFEKPGATWRSGGFLRNMRMDNGAQVLEDVRKLGRLPKAKKRTLNEDENAEKNYAVNSAGFKERAQIMLQELEASRDIPGSSSSQAACGNPITASGDLHSVVNPPHSAAS